MSLSVNLMRRKICQKPAYQLQIDQQIKKIKFVQLYLLMQTPIKAPQYHIYSAHDNSELNKQFLLNSDQTHPKSFVNLSTYSPEIIKYKVNEFKSQQYYRYPRQNMYSNINYMTKQQFQPHNNIYNGIQNAKTLQFYDHNYTQQSFNHSRRPSIQPSATENKLYNSFSCKSKTQTLNQSRKRGNSQNKRQKYITVVSRMPMNKKRISIPYG